MHIAESDRRDETNKSILSGYYSNKQTKTLENRAAFVENNRSKSVNLIEVDGLVLQKYDFDAQR